MFSILQLPDELIRKITDYLNKKDKKNYALTEKYTKEKFDRLPTSYYKFSRPGTFFNFRELITERQRHAALSSKKQEMEMCSQYFGSYISVEKDWLPGIFNACLIALFSWFRENPFLIWDSELNAIIIKRCMQFTLFMALIADLPILLLELQAGEFKNLFKNIQKNMLAGMGLGLCLALLGEGMMELGFSLSLTIFLISALSMTISAEKNTLQAFSKFLVYGLFAGSISGIVFGVIVEPLTNWHIEKNNENFCFNILQGARVGAANAGLCTLITGMSGFAHAQLHNSGNFEAKIKEIKGIMEADRIVEDDVPLNCQI